MHAVTGVRVIKVGAVASAAMALLLSVGCTTDPGGTPTGAGGHGGTAGGTGGDVGGSAGGAPGGSSGGSSGGAGGAPSTDADAGRDTGGGVAGAGGTGPAPDGGVVVTDPGTVGDGKMTINSPFQNDPAQTAAPGLPRGRRINFTMMSSDSKIYPLTPQNLPYQRLGAVWLPPGYVSGTEVPFMIAQDGVGNIQYVNLVPPALDNLINQKMVPSMAFIFLDPGPDVSGASERSKEYDTVSNVYTTFVETEVLPAAKKAVMDTAQINLVLTSDPEGRGSLGGSSGGCAAFTMAWFSPDLYRKVMSYSGSFVPIKAAPPLYPLGAGQYGNTLVAANPVKPIRLAMEVGSMDNGGPTGDRSWLEQNNKLFDALTAKGGYHVRFTYAVGAGHVDQGVQRQTFAGNLVWLWRGYPIK